MKRVIVTSNTHMYIRYARGLLQPQVLYQFMTNVIAIVFDVYASVYLIRDRQGTLLY